MEKKEETTIVYWGYIGMMEKNMETAIQYIGIIIECSPSPCLTPFGALSLWLSACPPLSLHLFLLFLARKHEVVYRDKS